MMLSMDYEPHTMRARLLAALVHERPLCDLSWTVRRIGSIWFVREADAIHTEFDDAYVVDTWVIGIGNIVVVYKAASVIRRESV